MVYSVLLKRFNNLAQTHLTGRTDKVSSLRKNDSVLTSLIFQLSEFSYLDMPSLSQAVKASWCDGQRQASNFVSVLFRISWKANIWPYGEGMA